MGLEIFFQGQKFLIGSDRMQILNLLLSTYEAAVQKNSELTKVQEELRSLNEQLENIVDQRTESLRAEVNDRKQAEETLKETLVDLERSNKDLEQFAYVASHDLQEPLRMVASYTQLIARRYKDKLDADANEFIGFAVDGAKRMQKMIDELLSYSRIETRGKPFETVNCTAILNQALTNLKMAIEESSAVITHDPLPIVKGDDSQLILLIQNLIGNAIKFRGEEAPHIHLSATHNSRKTTDDGRETIDHGRKTRDEGRGTIDPLQTQLSELKEGWIFSVKDNGIGIDPQYKERIFLTFTRLHGREDYPGNGIGLAVCKKIVEYHKGRIWVESEPGKGSIFYFSIPETGGLN